MSRKHSRAEIRCSNYAPSPLCQAVSRTQLRRETLRNDRESLRLRATQKQHVHCLTALLKLRSRALSNVLLYTDGACRGNPGPGGWAYILKHPATGTEREGSGGAADTTNNQMELMGVISGLQALTKTTSVEVVTDSVYVAKGSIEWLPKWKANDWRRREGKKWKPVKNIELWQQLDELLQKHEVRFSVVKGHSGHPENERCDELAVEAALNYQNQ